MESKMVVGKLYKKAYGRTTEGVSERDLVRGPYSVLRSFADKINENNEKDASYPKEFIIDEEATKVFYEERQTQLDSLLEADKLSKLSNTVVLTANPSNDSKAEEKAYRKELFAEAKELGLKPSKVIKTDKLEKLIQQQNELND